MKEVTIKELAAQLQKKIDSKLKSFTDDHRKLEALHMEAEELEKKMAAIVLELEPVQSLIYNQNPKLEKIFESLKRVYGKEDNGPNTETY